MVTRASSSNDRTDPKFWKASPRFKNVSEAIRRLLASLGDAVAHKPKLTVGRQLELGRVKEERSLRKLVNKVEPLTKMVELDIQRFADEVGVTDRFSTYRQNIRRQQLNPHNEQKEVKEKPEKLVIPRSRPPMATRFNTSWRAEAAWKERPNRPDPKIIAQRTNQTRNVIEAMENTPTYTGISETRERYAAIKGYWQGNSTGKGYTINPIPDFSATFSPPRCVRPDAQTGHSIYTSSYLWPPPYY
ncbi:hypothetical protein SprV_0602155800 [Sparganum proliferum]